jgi:hypothetical protein
MPRLRFLLAISPVFMLAACAALGSDETGGAGGSSGDPEAITKEILLGCSNNLEPAFHAELPWKLTVDPSRITSDETFGADFSGVAVLDEATLDAAQLSVFIPRGFKRVELEGLQATVHIREGAVGPDVVLNIEPPIQKTCTYDENGKADPDAGPDFPTCSEENDNPDDGSNSDCTGLGGVPSPENPCGRFVTIDTSDDCDPGGECLRSGRPTTADECDKNGFCVTGPVELPLEGSADFLTASLSGSVLFGWDDHKETTGAEELEDEDDCNFGTWELPEAHPNAPMGPTAMRINIGVLPLALECVMAVPSRFEDGVMSCDPLTSPTPDHRLIAFPIQQR